MPVCGIITEYNPLHNGHIYHLQQCRKIHSAVVCVMSGSFTQRGEPAIADKWQRAAWAVAAGADLVLELPHIYATGSAEIFATGAVRTLRALGLVDTLCFGSETADETFFKEAAACQLSFEYKTILQTKLSEGLAYHKAAAQALCTLLPVSHAQLALPNNILGIEYAKAIQKYAASIHLLPIKRQNSRYHDTKITSALSSATAVRQAIAHKDWINLKQAVPFYVYNYFRQNPPLPIMQILETLYLGKLKLSSLDMLCRIDNISEGLEHKILQAAVAATSIEELLVQISSARYPLSRLKRILLHCLFDITTELSAQIQQAGPQYARVLAFNDNGRRLLKRCKKTASIPLIMKTTQILSTKTRIKRPADLPERMLSLDTYATDIYELLRNRRGGRDFIQSPLYLPTARLTL